MECETDLSGACEFRMVVSVLSKRVMYSGREVGIVVRRGEEMISAEKAGILMDLKHLTVLVRRGGRDWIGTEMEE